MDITPILKRELLTVTRKSGIWWNRGTLAGILLAVILATFGARYYWDRGQVSDQDMMARVAFQAFLWMLAANMGMVIGVAARAAHSIAMERDRRTLDFLLATPLSSAEIVLGKLTAWIVFLFTEIGAGLPIMLLMNPLGGIDLRLILLSYGGVVTTGFFIITLAIWVSSTALDSRRAASGSVLWMMAWLMGPLFVSLVFTRVVLRLPEFILTVNAWVLTSSPMGLMFKIAGGVSPSSDLLYAVAWMSGLQVGGGVALIVLAIVQLRPAYRRSFGGGSQGVVARLTRPGWRWRRKPPVGDDPILWREINLARSGFLAKAIGLVVTLGMYCVLGYATYVFSRPALVEVWRHGYSSGVTSAERPDMNVVIRFFMTGNGVNPPPDMARTELNLFLRNVTVLLIFVIALFASGMASEAITSERAGETWDSLITTPLTARDILRSKMLAVLWRLRLLLATVIGLWLIGLVGGAIHPVGFAASVLVLAALIWLMLTFGTYVSIAVKDASTVTGATMGLILIMSCSGFLPLLLPARLNSVLIGAGSPSFVMFMSLVSYRDVRNAWHYPVYPFLQWIRIMTGEGPLAVATTCLIGALIPAVAGYYLWRSSLKHFDRLIGRPYKASPPAPRPLAIAPVADVSSVI